MTETNQPREQRKSI